MITTCTQCNTRFRVTPEQLAACQGKVRCGRCMEVFNGFADLRHEETETLPDISSLEAAQDKTLTAAIRALSGHVECTPPHPLWVPATDNKIVAEEKIAAFSPNVSTPNNNPLVQAEPEEISTIAASEIPETELILLRPETYRPPRPKPVAIALSMFLGLLLAGQAAYMMRSEIAANWPGTKPYLVGFCQPLGCNVQPRKEIDLVTIEASEMQADPTRPNVVLVTAILRNRSTTQQAYPLLEVTLTDTLDRPVARRSLTANEYLNLPPKEDETLSPNSETVTHTAIDTVDLKPSGYKLRVYYR